MDENPGSLSAVSIAPTRFCTSPRDKTCKPSSRSPWLARSTVPPAARLGEGILVVYYPDPGRSRMAARPRRRGGGGGSGNRGSWPGGGELRQPALAGSTHLRPPDPAVRCRWTIYPAGRVADRPSERRRWPHRRLVVSTGGSVTGYPKYPLARLSIRMLLLVERHW